MKPHHAELGFLVEAGRSGLEAGLGMMALRTASSSALLMIMAGGASAQISGDVVRIGVLNDQSCLCFDLTGYGAVVDLDRAPRYPARGAHRCYLCRPPTQAR
jgi:hypothetical protein